MRKATFLTLLLMATPAGAQGGSASLDELRISFSAADGEGVRAQHGGDATLELGDVSAEPCHAVTGPKGQARSGLCGPATLVRRLIRVHLHRATTKARFARLLVFLDADDPRFRVRVDGILLSTSPQLLAARALVGGATTHAIELEVPASEPPGQVLSAITWLAETE